MKETTSRLNQGKRHKREDYPPIRSKQKQKIVQGRDNDSIKAKGPDNISKKSQTQQEVIPRTNKAGKIKVQLSDLSQSSSRESWQLPSPKVRMTQEDRQIFYIRPKIKALVNLESKCYYPGSQVTGMIYLTVPDSNSAQKIKSVYLDVIGLERVTLSKLIPKSSVLGKKFKKSNPLTQEFGEKLLINETDVNYFIRHRFTIFDKNQFGETTTTIPTAEHQEIPFYFILPEQLPSSFRKEWISTDNALEVASIQYKARVIVLDSNGAKTTDTQLFLIQQPYKNLSMVKYHKMKFRMRSLLCLEMSPMVIEIQSNKAIYQYGDEVVVELKKANGGSRAQIEEVEGKLVRVICVKTTGGKTRRFEEVFYQETKPAERLTKRRFCIFQFELIGQREKTLKTQFEANMLVSKDHEKELDATNTGGEIDEISHPLEVEFYNLDTSLNLSSCESFLISCEYRFEAIVKTKGWLKPRSQVKISLKIPVYQSKSKIHSRRFKPPAMGYKPFHWEPRGFVVTKRPSQYIPQRSTHERVQSKRKWRRKQQICKKKGIGYFHREKLEEKLMLVGAEFDLIAEEEQIPNILFYRSEEITYEPKSGVEDISDAFEDPEYLKVFAGNVEERFFVYPISKEEYNDVLLIEETPKGANISEILKQQKKDKNKRKASISKRSESGKDQEGSKESFYEKGSPSTQVETKKLGNSLMNGSTISEMRFGCQRTLTPSASLREEDPEKKQSSPASDPNLECGNSSANSKGGERGTKKIKSSVIRHKGDKFTFKADFEEMQKQTMKAEKVEHKTGRKVSEEECDLRKALTGDQMDHPGFRLNQSINNSSEVSSQLSSSFDLKSPANGRDQSIKSNRLTTLKLFQNKKNEVLVTERDVGLLEDDISSQVVNFFDPKSKAVGSSRRASNKIF